MSSYSSISLINVGLDFGSEVIPVGKLASRSRKIYFEYDSSFLAKRLEISPLKIPLDTGLKTFNPFLFEGLPGVFNDSLPDGWGRLLLDRFLTSQNILPSEFTPLDRLAHIGLTGLGALVYEPDYSNEPRYNETIQLDELAQKAREVIEGSSGDVLQELITLNGSSAGARPKALLGVDKTKKRLLHGKQNLLKGFEHWLVKFPNSSDGNDAGAIEYVYSLMAKNAGVNMTETHLFPATHGAGYFATKRFDRNEKERVHIHTASGLLHSDFRVPSLDYENLLALTEFLTKDVREVKKMYRLAVFNVLSHNRDDHGKNFSFLMDKNGTWKLSPAYDLTFSSGPRGHQSTMVMGEGQWPSVKNLVELGLTIGMKQTELNEIIQQTKSAVSEWQKLAKTHEVSATNRTLIQKRIDGI